MRLSNKKVDHLTQVQLQKFTNYYNLRHGKELFPYQIKELFKDNTKGFQDEWMMYNIDN